MNPAYIRAVAMFKGSSNLHDIVKMCANHAETNTEGELHYYEVLIHIGVLVSSYRLSFLHCFYRQFTVDIIDIGKQDI